MKSEEPNGSVSPSPFSQRLLDLYREYQRASRERRAELSTEIAKAFAAMHDVHDLSASDDYHEYFEQFEQAKLQHDQACVRLTRLAVNVIDEYLERHGLQEETSVDSSVN